jgi:N-acetylneuraminic acid mutarotase
MSLNVYDTTTKTWAAASAPPHETEWRVTTAGTDGRIYVTGGFRPNGGIVHDAVADLDIYDPVALRWSSGKSLGTARMYHVAAPLPDGRTVVAGGCSDDHTSLSSAEVYDPAADTWSGVADLPLSLRGAAATMGPDGRVYVVGGTVGTGCDFTTANTKLYVYLPGQNRWVSSE